MNALEEPSTQQQHDFPSVESLRRSHTTLLRRNRSGASSDVPDPVEIADFIRFARATGRNIAAADSRDTVQGIIDYWYGILVMINRNLADSIVSLNLDEFDVSKVQLDSISGNESRARAEAALTKKVEAFDGRLLETERPLLRRVLLRLFHVGETANEVLRGQFLKSDDILTIPEAVNLVSSLVEAGLLTTEAVSSAPDAAYVLMNDSLLKSWPILHDLVIERRSLREMTSGWEKARRSPEALLERGPLLDMAADYVDLKQSERDFLSESRQASTRRIAEHQRARNLWTTILAFLAITLLVLLVWIGFQNRSLASLNAKLIESNTLYNARGTVVDFVDRLNRAYLSNDKELRTKLLSEAPKHASTADALDRSLIESSAASIFLRDAKAAEERGDYPRQRDLLLKAESEVMPDYMRPYVLRELANVHRTLREFPKALSYMQKAAELSGKDASSLMELAIYQKLNGQIDEAIKSLDKALVERPGSLAIRLIRAGYLVLSGKVSEGVSSFNEIHDQLEVSGFYNANLAWFYAVMNDREKFYTAFERALRTATPEDFVWIDQETDIDKFRQDERFKDLLKKFRKKADASKAADF